MRCNAIKVQTEDKQLKKIRHHNCKSGSSCRLAPNLNPILNMNLSLDLIKVHKVPRARCFRLVSVIAL